jgi:phosphonoacetate hydrolase
MRRSGKTHHAATQIAAPAAAKTVVANGRLYRFPATPAVVVCIDGSEPGYIEAAIEAGVAPNLQRFVTTGTATTAQCIMPSYTNPNNISIITGQPPSVHGISGNYFFDRTSGEEVMMNDAKFMRAGVVTIVKAFQDAGASVAVVTAKDKLCALLGNGLDTAGGRGIAFSAEKADTATIAANGVGDVLALAGRPLPQVYSADLSEFVFAAGVQLMETRRPDLMYLSTTDYVQHKAAPGSAMANAFYAMLDRYAGLLDQAGCTVVLTADHGMNAKHRPDGTPDVIYLQDLLDDWLGRDVARVILPITDPYVVHHGALGSFATVYLPANVDHAAMTSRLAAVPGIQMALSNAEACARFDLPADRTGDIVLIAEQQKALGSARTRHDLSGLTEPLRSHGGLSEQTVPMIANRRFNVPRDRALRNFDAFEAALNLIAPAATE